MILTVDEGPKVFHVPDVVVRRAASADGGQDLFAKAAVNVGVLCKHGAGHGESNGRLGRVSALS